MDIFAYQIISSTIKKRQQTISTQALIREIIFDHL